MGGVQHKLLLKLLEFDYVVEYKKGKENVVVDALSRREVNSYATTFLILNWVEEVKSSYTTDPKCSELLEFSRDNP